MTPPKSTGENRAVALTTSHFANTARLFSASYSQIDQTFYGLRSRPSRIGWSDISPGASYQEPAVRRQVVEFIEKLDPKDLTLAGESIGATLSLTASTELGRRVRHIVALNTYDYPEGVERANLLASIVVKAMRLPVLGLMFSKLENALILRGVMRGGFFDPRRLPKIFSPSSSEVAVDPATPTSNAAIFAR